MTCAVILPVTPPGSQPPGQLIGDNGGGGGENSACLDLSSQRRASAVTDGDVGDGRGVALERHRLDRLAPQTAGDHVRDDRSTSA